jgi:hypothetical protein
MKTLNLKYLSKEYKTSPFIKVSVFLLFCFLLVLPNLSKAGYFGFQAWVVKDTYAVSAVAPVKTKRPNTKAELMVYFPENDSCKPEIALFISSAYNIGAPKGREYIQRSMVLSSGNKKISGKTMITLYENGADIAFKCTEEDLFIFNYPSVTVDYSDISSPITYTTENAKDAIALAKRNCKSRI